MVSSLMNTSDPEFVEKESYVFPDFRALQVLGIWSVSDVSFEEITIFGYEIYIVEQWAAERRLSTLITSYNGNSGDQVLAVRVLLPKNLEMWSDKFKAYYDELIKFSSPKVIGKHTVFITDLSSVPSGLNILQIQCGDFKKAWELFKINYDLKRLRCGGRSALLLKSPSMAVANKFALLYKIPRKTHTSQHHDDQQDTEMLHSNEFDVGGIVNLDCPVVELVTIIQTCLSYFSLFEFIKEQNGLLCNYTKQGIVDWWDVYGKIYLGRDRPKTEATMGPTSVASLISLVLSCYFKLMVLGFMSADDPFNEKEFFSGVYAFQKKHNLSKNHKKTYLDENTVHKLFELTDNASSTDIFKIKTVVKSTMKDISGKGNFLQLSNDVLTTDLQVLIKNIYDGKLAALWKEETKSSKNYTNLREKDFTRLNFSNGDLQKILAEQDRYLQRQKTTESGSVHSPCNRNGTDKTQGIDETLPKNTFGNPYQNFKTCTGTFEKSDICGAQYHNEFNRRNSITFNNDGTNWRILKTGGAESLHRCNSMSGLSDITEKWTLPFDSSVVRIARDVLRVKREFSKDDCLDKQPQCSDSSWDGYPKELKIFDQASSNVGKRSLSTLKQSRMLQGQCLELESKEGLLSREMKELDSMVAQLRYNIKVLNTRVIDVERSVGRFDSELARVTGSILSLIPDTNNSGGVAADIEEFKRYINNLGTAEVTKYEGFCIKIFQNNLFSDLKKNVDSWFRWMFGGLNHHQNSSEA
ncbi:Stb6p KNAG_0H00430 [Huiozyma naganishii CBS 8797]|uniref:STB6-like N-terminal domain-containing protein n=1 Tax=Huiozyma naganishii (strain ATCC MYA-139 / BCRC 22969 / CBS 8797 / KCTC 17520 / NBRC 10181 / NCYC 3082 / Yp74L-3) TaxID=1071383 RepID=J7S8C5_HUIN7|nr:hypothetical protein KNAG_0H00430 [Kazachstania naganishii CBS 8797]CCK71459.1 hypothetical protein KNAG_0H00430 [Kazachstania naganishii CBS 8797]